MVEDTTQNGIIIISGDKLPVLAREIAGIMLDELSHSAFCSVSSMPDNPDTLVTKAKAYEILDRCDSTLSKWAKRGILIPVRREGSLYYRLGEVMKIYNGR